MAISGTALPNTGLGSKSPPVPAGRNRSSPQRRHSLGKLSTRTPGTRLGNPANPDELKRISKDILGRRQLGNPVAFEAWHIIHAHADYWRFGAPVEAEGARIVSSSELDRRWCGG